MAESKFKYPKQCVAIKRTKKILGFDAELYTPKEDDYNTPPLQMHSGFSRIVATIVDTETENTPTANIPASEIGGVLQETLSVRNAVHIRDICGFAPAKTDTVSASAPADASADSPAYKVKLIDNNFRNMTPAEVLLQDPANKEKLLRNKTWLESNLEKYPRNATQIEAIEEAIKLLDAGNLKAPDASAAPAPVAASELQTIYESDFKFKSATNEKGYNLIYKISVKYDTNPEKKYPVIVRIDNMHAPVETSDGGQKKIVMSKAENKKFAVMNLTYAEWLNAINHMNTMVQDFEMIFFKKQWTIAEENSYHHE